MELGSRPKATLGDFVVLKHKKKQTDNGSAGTESSGARPKVRTRNRNRQSYVEEDFNVQRDDAYKPVRRRPMESDSRPKATVGDSVVLKHKKKQTAASPGTESSGARPKVRTRNRNRQSYAEGDLNVRRDDACKPVMKPVRFSDCLRSEYRGSRYKGSGIDQSSDKSFGDDDVSSDTFGQSCLHNTHNRRRTTDCDFTVSERFCNTSVSRQINRDKTSEQFIGLNSSEGSSSTRDCIRGLKGTNKPYPKKGNKEKVNSKTGCADDRHLVKCETTKSLCIKRLKEIARLDPKDIVLELTVDGSGFEELLNEKEMSREVQLITLKLLARACKCLSLSMQLNHLLVIVWKSTYLTKHLQQLVTTFPTASGEYVDDILQTQMDNVMILMVTLLQQIPSSCSEVGVLILLLEKVVKDIKQDDKDHEGNFKRVQDMKNLYETLSRDDSDRVTQAEMKAHYRSPPNDFRHIPLLPASSELRSGHQPFLRQNLTTGKYVDANHYLDVQFRLLREDFVSPLRQGISDYLAKQNSQDVDKHSRIEDIRIYSKVHILTPMVGNDGITHSLQFDVNPLSSVQWEFSKRLLPGSLVCLTKDNFQTVIFAIVKNRDTLELQKGRLVVQFNSPNDITGVKARETFLMAETTAYFEQYRPVLLGLQEMGKQDLYGDTPALPMERYIVQTSRTVLPPSYLSDKENTAYDLHHLAWKKVKYDNSDCDNILKSYESSNVKCVSLLQTGLWPPAEMLQFDDSQLAAFQTALTSEFALIQGPPGTGKTHIGLKVVQTLLFNRHVWGTQATNEDTAQECKHILVVCYTNHALDQFLEGIQKFEEKIFRIGGGSSSEMLKSRNLAEIRYQRRRRRRRTDQRRVHPDYDRLKRLLENAEDRLDLARKGIISDQSLEPYMTETQVSSFNLFGNHQHIQIHEGMTILHWLGLVDDQQEKEIDGKTKQLGHFLQEIEVENDDDTTELLGEAELIAHLRQMDEENPIMRANRSERQKILLHEFAFVIGSGSRHPNHTSEDIKRMEEILNYELENMQDVFTEQEASEIVDVWSVHPEHRWRLYRYWLAKYVEAHEKKILQYQEIYQNLAYQQKEIEIEEDEEILRDAKVIGMTTTGAAKHRSLLQVIKPRIIVIEEAAEVLEAHVITTLTSDCQHLILIGDHQQLRPNPTVYRLAKQFKLDISLFERMINNRLPCRQLHLQHRMRPEISILMKRHFYKHLQDHKSVLTYDNVLGVSQNIFFIQHNEKENDVDDSKSKSNIHETAFLVQLCRYLLQQGYSPSQITILATYTGQVMIFKRQMDNITFKGVKVCVVDNYQGEENDVILLSLVRSNDEGNVGFLKVENRVCVALSRARKGLFCIGNLELLAKRSQLWRDIKHTLTEKQITGRSLPLVCQTHSRITEVAFPEDFDNVPDGGCSKTCDFRLSCGHVCSKSCHPVDPEHDNFVCAKQCVRKCVRGHACQRECGEDCICDVKVTVVMTGCCHKQTMPCNRVETWACKMPCKKTLECGHLCTKVCGKPCLSSSMCKEPCKRKCIRDHACELQCGIDCKCEEQIKKTMYPCKHIQILPCHKYETWKCQATCSKRCVRDHACTLKCGKFHSNCKCDEILTKTMSICGHKQKVPCNVYDSWLCKEPCKKTLDCGHLCRIECGQACKNSRCKERCERKLSCGHRCKKLCYKMCADKNEIRIPTCSEEVGITLPGCLHKRKILCKDKPDKMTERRLRSRLFTKPYPECVEMCQKRLPCGHECPNKCIEPCITDCKTTIEKTLPCGHYQKVLCCDADKTVCKEQCEKELPCGHTCQQLCKNMCMCKILVDKELPHCRHIKRLECCADPKDSICDKACSKALPCGHSCKNACRDPCQTNCNETVLKTLPACGHKIQMRCDGKPETVLCKNNCSVKLQCGHVCKRKCYEPCSTRCKVQFKKILPCGHKKLAECWKQEKDLECTKKCSKRSSCGHTCQKKCSEECKAESEILVKKTMPECKHTLLVKCFEDVRDVLCTAPCEKRLPCGHQCEKRCSDTCETKCQVKQVKEMKDCNHRQTVPCFVDVDDHICQARCKKQLKCGHSCVKLCGQFCDCGITKEKKIPGCGHMQHVKCQVKINDHICQDKCRKKLSCGHDCPNRCGEPCVSRCEEDTVKTFPECKHKQAMSCYMNPNEQKCLAPCKQKLPCGHSCSNKCREPCLCQQKTVKILPKCKHEQALSCFINPIDFKCTLECLHILRCGHACSNICGEPCVTRCEQGIEKEFPRCKHKQVISCCIKPEDIKCPYQCRHCGHPCQQNGDELCGSKGTMMVIKELSKCNHRAKMICCQDVIKYICPFQCERKLKCGHTCRNKCAEPCTENCQVLVRKRILGARCPHTKLVECSQKVTATKHQCLKKMACGHTCLDTCGEPCRCNAICSKRLTCGHSCKELCGKPCTKVCDVKVYNKIIAECGHRMAKAIPCHARPKPEDCNRICGQQLACGHMCQIPCNLCDVHNNDPEDGSLCEEKQPSCQATCNTLLPCGHRCTYSCDECHGGEKHKPCRNGCRGRRSLLCGCRCM